MKIGKSSFRLGIIAFVAVCIIAGDILVVTAIIVLGFIIGLPVHLALSQITAEVEEGKSITSK